jgi:hypothetical protein
VCVKLSHITDRLVPPFITPILKGSVSEDGVLIGLMAEGVDLLGFDLLGCHLVLLEECGVRDDSEPLTLFYR